MDAQLVAFTGVAAGIVALPGADFTVVVRNALSSRRAGVACAVGVVAGLLVHTALAVAGVAAVLTAVPALFGALQIVGGAYVLYLAWRAVRSATRPRPSTGHEPMERGGGLREGFLTNALNPKASLTFLSVLPQFVPDGSPAMPRTLLLAGVVVALALLWFPVVALTVDRLGRWLRRPRAARAVEAVTGAALGALGLALLLAPLRT
ncbi:MULTISPECIES: LysE family translocator [Streptomyces]|uniref:LysE family translocator n=1 Tax=Streptomyces TaxID=1883 RepID=UPI001E2E0E1F|nr:MULTISPECIES: LysE family translocator [Streptomyces]UFQ13889.1 LysE family translocator [Streptomyces huasconensis]WCL83487.1 LysE family translocator [Streptomyces sp. JCM 35825]